MKLHRLIFVSVLGLLAAVSPAAGDELGAWVEVRSPNFLVVSNAGQGKAKDIAAHFEEIRTIYRTALPNLAKFPSPLITILAAKDEKSLRELLPEYWEKGHSHPAGMFIAGQNRFYILLQADLFGPRAYQVVYHEYFHSLTVPYYGALPVWLKEGLADFYARAEVDKKEVNLGVPDPVYLRFLQRENFIPLDVLFKVNQSSPYYNEKEKTGIFYAESWVITHYLLLGDNSAHRKQLADYLNRLSHGEPEDEAARAAFGDLGQLQKQVSDYVGHFSMSFRTIKAPPQLDAKEFQARVISPAEALARQGDSFICRHHPKEARPLVEEALRRDSNLALAHEAMGLLDSVEGKREAAILSLAEAIQLDPNDFYTHYYRGLLLEAGPPNDNETRIESDLKLAIKLNPDFAPAYAALANLYLRPEKDASEALSLAQKANQFDPSSTYYKVLIGRALLQMGRIAEATYVAQRALATAEDPPERAEAQHFMTAVEEYQREMTNTPKAQGQRTQSGANVDNSTAPTPGSPQQTQPGSVVPSGEEKATPSGLPASASGKISNVRCDGVALNLTLGMGGYTLDLHAGNFMRIEFYSLSWKPPANFNPCRDLTGHRAKINYTPVKGASYGGVITRLELIE